MGDRHRGHGANRIGQWELLFYNVQVFNTEFGTVAILMNGSVNSVAKI